MERRACRLKPLCAERSRYYSVSRRETRTTSRDPHTSDRQTIMRTAPFLLGVLACLSTLAQAMSAQNNPPGNAPASQPNAGASLYHDRHDGMDVAADAYIDTERAKEKFGKANPVAAGILPVEVTLHNETTKPVRVDLSTIQLEVNNPEYGRQDIDWLSAEQVADAIAHPNGPPPPQVRRFPVGIPLSSKDKKTEKLAEILRPLAFDADIIPPMATIHGFLFFNMNHRISHVENLSLYIPDAKFIPSNQPLMFFEIPLGNSSKP